MSLKTLLFSPLGQTIILTAGIPFALRSWHKLSTRSKSTAVRRPSDESVRSRRFRLWLVSLLVAFSLTWGIVFRPLDPFTELSLSITVPASTLRREWQQRHSGAHERIAMLTSLDNRLALLRYGDATFTPLTSAPDGQKYRFVLAMILKTGPYAVAALGLGVLLETSGRQRRRGTFASLLLMGWLAEGYMLFSDFDRETKIDRNLHLARWLAFCALFCLAYLVSASPSSSAAEDSIAPKLVAIHGLQDRARQRLLVLSATREAILRDDELRLRFVNFWSSREAADRLARDHATVAKVRERLELQPKGAQYEILRDWLEQFGGVKRAQQH